MAQHQVLCGVPTPSCTGSTVKMLKSWHGHWKAHNGHADAFACYRRYLLSLGYVALSSREFEPPDGGPIRLLTRQGKFGAELRKGKRPDQGSDTNNKMPVFRFSKTIIG